MLQILNYQRLFRPPDPALPQASPSCLAPAPSTVALVVPFFQWCGGLSSNHILSIVSSCGALVIKLVQAFLLRQRAPLQGSSACSGKSLQSLVDIWQANLGGRQLVKLTGQT
ncbi:Hypothetical_protein [Hexamita inflata]|uniref:Hypothetical_protein n=1 Tax=Hexamita inflata TaxID=28002 RepID=A0AA86QH51_9EUKA|nr:Hypothetical protein HINF_LOCUS46881 [Hexamita inflata]